jgi:putative heme-binding domain-containing protein
MVNWSEGKSTKGKKIFVNRACQNCHSGASALGPDLMGAAKRLAPEDLFRTILFPNRDISPLYRFNEYRMHNGDVHVGRTAFYAADGIVLKTGSGIIRLDQKNIVSQQASERSIMPEGLLEGLKMNDLADLYQYLKSL